MDSTILCKVEDRGSNEIAEINVLRIKATFRLFDELFRCATKATYYSNDASLESASEQFREL